MLQKTQQIPPQPPQAITTHNENPTVNTTLFNQPPPAPSIENNIVIKQHAPSIQNPRPPQPPVVTNDIKPINVPVQPVIPTTIIQTVKPLLIPILPPVEKKHVVISPLNSTYTDPLEQSLANLENDTIKTEPLDNTNIGLTQMPSILNNPIQNSVVHPINVIPSAMLQQPNLPMVDIKPPISTNSNMMPVVNSMHNIHSMHPIHMAQELPMIHPNTTVPNTIMHSTNNGFALKSEYELNQNNNGMTSLTSGIPMNMSIPSIFDPLPVTHVNNAIIKKESKPTIEELLEPMPNLNVTDKKQTPPEQKYSQGFGFKAKQEQNIKNASSWSSLGQSNNSPQNSNTSFASSTTATATTANNNYGNNRQQVMDSFKAFQKQAKEKADREKQRLENLEMKRQQKEQAERERIRMENEKRREKEEEDALEKARYTFLLFL